jgi:hypothetical protein
MFLWNGHFGGAGEASGRVERFRSSDFERPNEHLGARRLAICARRRAHPAAGHLPAGTEPQIDCRCRWVTDTS